MGTEILRSHDCLIQRVRVSPCRRRNYHYHGHVVPNYSNNSTSSARLNRKPAAGGGAAGHRSDQKKRHQPDPSVSKRSTSADDLRISRNQGGGSLRSHSLVMDKVTILRRGESLDSRVVSGGDATPSAMVANGTERIGPGPEGVPRQMRIVEGKPPQRKADVYAGSAFAMSPAPSALPLPSFSKKKQVSVDDSATRDLCRLLRLDL